MKTSRRPPTRRRASALALLVPLIAVFLQSCAAAREDPEFAVVFGDDGVAITDGHWIEQVPLGVPAIGTAGPEAVGLDASSAAVVAGGRVAVVSPHEPAVVVECDHCAGIAATDESIVSTRKNFTPGDGFDIVVFSHDLEPMRSVPARRLEERASTGYPAENTASPITLAADAERVTVGYLARDGGVRAGPSVIAQYDYDGRLLGRVFVDGILGSAAVSPDQHYLAVGVGGSGGACITVSEPVVIDLRSLQTRTVEPTVPAAVVTDSASLSEPWFMLTDLYWRGSTLVATGELHNPAPEEICDSRPEMWQRSFEPDAARLVDSGDLAARAIRWAGPGCDHLLAVTAPWEETALVRTTDGPEQQLGNFQRIALGRPAMMDCNTAS